MRFAKKMTGRLKARSGGNSPANNAGWFYSALRPTSAGVVIDEAMALNLAGIWRAVNVKTADLAKMPVYVYDRLPNGGKRPNMSSKVYELLNYPNTERTGRKQRHTAATHLTLWGNSYQEIIRDPETGEPERLELLDPRWVVPRRDHNNRLTYWLRGSTSPWSGKKELLAENVIHFSGLSLNGDHGMSPIQSGSDPLATASALDKYAGSLWGNGAVPNGYIECPPGWPDDARANFRQAWQEEHGGVTQANRVAILEEGAKFVATSFDPEKLQMLASREFSVVEIARIVNVPPYKLFDMSHDVQRSLEEMNLDYYESEIEPICQGMADEYALKLFTVGERKRLFIGFDGSRLMRGKALERAQTNQIKLQNGVITWNEWRAEDGLNPFEIDGRIMPLNMAEISAEVATDAEADPDLDQPNDPEPLPDTAPNPLADPIADSSRAVVREALRRMTRREILGLRKLADRGQLEPSTAETYYAELSPVYLESVGPALTLHRRALGLATNDELLDRLLDDSREAIATSETPAATLDAWDATKVDDLLNRIEATDGQSS
jgi:HK97 family phage portal protein